MYQLIIMALFVFFPPLLLFHYTSVQCAFLNYFSIFSFNSSARKRNGKMAMTTNAWLLQQYVFGDEPLDEALQRSRVRERCALEELQPTLLFGIEKTSFSFHFFLIALRAFVFSDNSILDLWQRRRN